jgi:hypothetical protein
MLPKRPPLFSTASATTPAISGDDELVPMSANGPPPIQAMTALRGNSVQFCLARSASLGQPPIIKETSGTERCRKLGVGVAVVCRFVRMKLLEDVSEIDAAVGRRDEVELAFCE